MLRSFWSWLTKKGVVLTLALAFLITALINNYIGTSEENTVLLVFELTFIGGAVATAIYIFGYTIFGEDWPGLEKLIGQNRKNYSVIDQALDIVEDTENKISQTTNHMGD